MNEACFFSHISYIEYRHSKKALAMRDNLKVILLCLCLSTAYSSPANAQEIKLAAMHWPPWVIIDQDRNASGVVIDIVQELADLLAFELVVLPCSRVRCLRLMKEGKSDLMGTLLRRPERELFLHYLEPEYKISDKLIYLNKNSPIKINQYQDLYTLDSIAIVEGTKYAPKFDEDKKLPRYSATQELQQLMLLNNKRVQALIMDEAVADYLIAKHNLNGRFIKAYRFANNQKKSYITLSRKSAYAKQKEKFDEAMQKIISSGATLKYLKKYTQ